MEKAVWSKRYSTPSSSSAAVCSEVFGCGSPIVLGSDDKPTFNDSPAEFNAVCAAVSHGELEMVEYDSKSVGVRRKMNVYTSPGYSAE